MKLEITSARIHRGTMQFYVAGGGERTDDMITWDGIRGFSSNGGPVDWDEIENADEAADFARAAIAKAQG
jgi:hypothetical protein